MAKINKWGTIAAILILVLTLGVLLVPAHIAQANGGITPVYVNIFTGNDDWDGSSPTYVSGTIGPKKTYLDGYNAVSSGGTIYLAAGSYTEPGINYTKPLTLVGAGAHCTFLSGAGLQWVMRVSVGPATISGVTIQNGKGSSSAGGLGVTGSSTVTVNDCVIKNNIGRNGGGVGTDPGATLTMNRCTISGNSSPNTGYGGGGIFNADSTVILTNCTISGNTTSSGAGHGYGGGINNWSSTSTMTLTNCTLVNNTNTGTPGQGGGFFNCSGCTLTFKNTIVANNTATGGGNNGYNEAGGTVTSQGYNIDSENSCGFSHLTDKINTDPLLGPLQDNGGSTFTHALLTGSPAIDAGTCTGAPTIDQRGVFRPQGASCDIGAYELGTAPASVATATGTGIATFTTSSGYISGLTAWAQSQLACGDTPGLLNFTHGFFSFNIINLTPGATVTITITLPSNMPQGTQYWNCINVQWVDFTSILGSNDGDNVLTLTITDGGPFDADGQANGTIVDPGGPGEAAATAPAGPRASATPPKPLNPAQMSLQYLSVTPQQASANQPVTITTNVVNTGDEAGNLNVALKINGLVEQSRMVSVGPQGTQPVKFTVTKDQPGTYTVDILGKSGSFTILGTGGTTGAPVNSGLIALLIIGVLVLATVVVLLISRRPAQ